MYINKTERLGERLRIKTVLRLYSIMVKTAKEKRSGNIVLMGFTSLINDISSEMITPILPILLTSLGASGLVIGLLGGVRESVASLLSIYFGKLSDKTKARKPFVISGYLVSGVFKLTLFLSAIFGSWIGAFASASLEKLGKAVRNAPRDALISESIEKGQLGRGFGFHRMMDSMGAVIGSILTLILIYYLKIDFGTIIIAAAVLAFVSVIPLIFLKEGKTTEIMKNSKNVKDERTDRLVMIMSLFALGNISYMFLILKAQTLFSPDLAIVGPIALYVLFNVFYTMLAIPFGRIADNVGKKKTLNVGYALLFLTMVGFVFASSLEVYILLFILYGASYAIIETQQAAVISGLAAEGKKGAAIGKYYTGVGISKLVGSTFAGFIWMINPIYSFVYASLMTILGTILLLKFNHIAKKA
jgi:MFS family permease